MNWLDEGRDGGDEAARLQTALVLDAIRDRILNDAALTPGCDVLDVGAGGGLVGFGAIGRNGPDGVVVFADSSPDALSRCKATADQMGVSDRCGFALTTAETLLGVADASVDVLTTRSVLMHVGDKPGAWRSFYRVLKPGGRVSLFEMITSFERDRAKSPAAFLGYDTTPVEESARRLVAWYETVRPADSDPMLNFDDRSLFHDAEAAGFQTIRTDVWTTQAPTDPVPWDYFVRRSVHPEVPNLAEAMDRVLSIREREAFERHLRPMVEAGTGTWRRRTVFLYAQKATDAS